MHACQRVLGSSLGSVDLRWFSFHSFHKADLSEMKIFPWDEFLLQTHYLPIVYAFASRDISFHDPNLSEMNRQNFKSTKTFRLELVVSSPQHQAY